MGRSDMCRPPGDVAREGAGSTLERGSAGLEPVAPEGSERCGSESGNPAVGYSVGGDVAAFCAAGAATGVPGGLNASLASAGASAGLRPSTGCPEPTQEARRTAVTSESAGNPQPPQGQPGASDRVPITTLP